MRVPPILWSVLTTLPLTAQSVTWQAITQSGMSVAVTSAGTQTVPPLTDVRAGVNLLLQSATSMAKASVGFQAASTPDTLTYTMSADGGGGFGPPFAQSGQSGPNDVLLTLATATRTAVILRFEYCGSRTQYGTADLALRIGAGGALGTVLFTPLPDSLDCVFGPKVATFKAFLDATPLPITMQASAGGGAGMGRVESGWVRGKLIVTADPEWPCRPVAYGSECGSHLGFATSLSHPGSTLITLTDTGAPSHFWMLVGDQKVQLPIGSCTILNNGLVLLPMVRGTANAASVRVIPPPIAGLSFLLQGATWDGATLRFTAGAEVFCF